MTTDVQLTTEGVALDFTDVQIHYARPAVGEVMAILTPDEFDVFAEQVAEAALNKRGMEYVSALVSDAEVGWFYGELEIINVRPKHLAEDLTAVNFAAGPGFLLIESGLILRFTRPIQ